MYYSVIAAGFGGQGIIQLGKILAQCGMLSGLQVTCISSYGAEVRGGTANTTIIFSDREIGSPVVTQPEGLIVMNSLSFTRFIPAVKTGGDILVNTSLIDLEQLPARDDLKVTKISATGIAELLGLIKAANMVALGAFTALTGLFPLDSARQCVRDTFSSLPADLIKLNISALEQGYGQIKPL